MSQRTLLFLIADTGAGHRSAANAIRNAITLIAQQEREAQQLKSATMGETDEIPALPTYRIEIVDVFDEYSQFPLREAMKLYGPAIRYNPKLYGQIFHISNQPRRINVAQNLANPLIHNGLLRLITTVKPDVIISIHALLNYVTLEALQQLGLPIPFITVVTDLISVHHAWYTVGADSYIVPTEYAKELYLERGLDAKRVHMLGMPIDPKFTLPVASREELRQKLDLKPNLPVVLLVGGGEGSGGLRASVRAISQARLPVQLLIVTGRNKRLYTQLQRSRSSLHVPAKVMGFVNNMPELMHAADVLVTKAGPGTICEAMACQLPVILNSYVPGQEEGNVSFVVDNNVGVLAEDALELVDALRRLLKPGSGLLRTQLENAKRISRPSASFAIGKHILSYLPAPDQPSIWDSKQSDRRRRKVSSRLRAVSRLRPLPRLRTSPRKTSAVKHSAPTLERTLLSRLGRVRLGGPSTESGLMRFRRPHV